MAKTETEQRFDHLVSKIIWPHFKAVGYKKKGNNLRYYDPEEGFGKIVNFQKSMFQDKDHIRFTVNIGLYLSDFEFYAYGTRSMEKFTEPYCPVRKRIGKLKEGYDLWYDLDRNTDMTELENRVEQDFLQNVIPYLNRYQSFGDILQQLLVEQGVTICNIYGQVRILYYNGYRQQASQLITEKYKRATEPFKKTLDELKKELNL